MTVCLGYRFMYFSMTDVRAANCLFSLVSLSQLIICWFVSCLFKAVKNFAMRLTKFVMMRCVLCSHLAKMKNNKLAKVRSLFFSSIGTHITLQP